MTMKRRCLLATIAIALVLVPADLLVAQSASAPKAAVGDGRYLVGASVATGRLAGDASVAIGLEGGVGIAAAELGVRMHTYSLSSSAGGVSENARFTSYAVSLDYPLTDGTRRFVPYVGGAFGYLSVSYSSSYGLSFSGNSGSFFMGNAGARYAMTDRLLLQASVSVTSREGTGLLRTALMFRP